MLELKQIDKILKDHGINFKRTGNDYFIIDDEEMVSNKELNSITKIRNWLGY